MKIIKSASAGARAALFYITLGALMMVWTTVWYVYLNNFPPRQPLPYYLCCGLFVSGLVLVGIGLAVGRIGQAARPADQPPDTAVVASTAPPVVTASHNGSESATPLAPAEREVAARR